MNMVKHMGNLGIWNSFLELVNIACIIIFYNNKFSYKVKFCILYIVGIILGSEDCSGIFYIWPAVRHIIIDFQVVFL